MFDIIVDSTSNITEDLAAKYNIRIISNMCRIDGQDYVCYEPGRNDEEEGKFFYDKLRQGADIKTSLLEPGRLMEVFAESFDNGNDVLFVCMSSGLTGTCQSASVAADDLKEDYPDRRCIVVDSMSASLGEGFLAIRAAKMRGQGCSIEEAAKWIEDNKLKMRQIFTVDDLKFLRRGGRISGTAALLGSVLGVKPVLYATDKGTIELHSPVRGRKKSIKALINDFMTYVDIEANDMVGIAHCDCKAEAMIIEDAIREKYPDIEIVNKVYDRCSGAHVGPGALCVFFMGKNRGY